MRRERRPPAPEWIKWLRAAAKDDPQRIGFAPSALAMLTGQDARTLAAIDACWALYACCDDDGERGVLDAVRALLPAMQSKCHFFARALIARHLDWTDRDRVWALVSVEGRNAAALEQLGALTRAARLL